MKSVADPAEDLVVPVTDPVVPVARAVPVTDMGLVTDPVTRLPATPVMDPVALPVTVVPATAAPVGISTISAQP